ncbi:hypothetical protein [Joostella sp.]|uniref:hypothetical protein n=1 Tax=Joostella sp. TaxID=2231138 RepID=UPI003A8F92C3
MPNYNYGESVYHICDKEQSKLLVTGVIHRGGDNYTYLVSSEFGEKECVDIELSREKTIF